MNTIVAGHGGDSSTAGWKWSEEVLVPATPQTVHDRARDPQSVGTLPGETDSSTPNLSQLPGTAAFRAAKLPFRMPRYTNGTTSAVSSMIHTVNPALDSQPVSEVVENCCSATNETLHVGTVGGDCLEHMPALFQYANDTLDNAAH